MSQLTVNIYPIGKVDPTVAEAAAAALADHYGVAVQVGPPLPLPAGAYDPGRGQYEASAILSVIPAPPPGELSLGIVDVDCFVPGLNFVFGLASGRRALICVARLRDPSNHARERRRIATEAVHEIGHLLGLRHCPDPTCAMFFSNTLADTDAKGPGLCARCRRLAEAAVADA